MTERDRLDEIESSDYWSKEQVRYLIQRVREAEGRFKRYHDSERPKYDAEIKYHADRARAEEAENVRLRARVEELEGAMRVTHQNWCGPEYTDQYLHHPNCLIGEVEDD